MWLPLAAALAIVLVFLWLNRGAYDGFFQDDELDNISWAPYVSFREFALALIKPVFDKSNFRPVGHAYFALAGSAFGMDFPPYMTPIFAIHLLNGTLLFALIRKLGMGVWHALAGAAFFVLSAAAFDAYWKPMYVFDLLCATFCLSSILLFAHGRWILSFVAFWLAYKSKELAVMLPVVLLAYEYWLGKKKFIPLIPFFLTSLSFGIQGILFNPNIDNEYTFRFTPEALRVTVPFYARRLLLFRYSGLLLFLLIFTRERRVWFGLLTMSCFVGTLLFLPGRLYEAYAYLPLAGASIALAAAVRSWHPAIVWSVLSVWMIFNVHHVQREQKEKLARDDKVSAYVEALQSWAARHPQIRTLVYSNPPDGFHNWGVGAAWNIAHETTGLPSLYVDSAAARAALANDDVAFTYWDDATKTIALRIHSPE